MELASLFIADQTPGLIWISGPDRRAIWFNRAWLAFTGRSIEHEIGDGWIEGVHPEDRDRCAAIYRAAFDARQPFAREYRLRCHDGEYRWLLDNGAPLYDDHRSFTGYVGLSVDITERRRVEEERAHLLAAAETSNRLKDEFLATLSHELRTPLNTVLGWTHLLREGARSEAEIKNALDVIERNVRAQSKLVDDVLDVSRIVSGKLRLELQTVDIANVVQGVVGVLQPAADAKGVVLSSDIRHGHGFVAGDGARLHQAIWNVVSNAVKFTRRGGSVHVDVARRGHAMEVSVADTGKGIPPEFLPHLFERFSRAKSGHAQEYGGLGLGLAIVRHLIELHGGTVTIHSAGVDQGTTVTLRLPLLAVHPSEVAHPSPPSDQATVAGIRVLAVDDDLDARGLVKAILEMGGAIVTTAESAAEAYAAMEREQFDVLLSDLAMPGEDGCELMRRIRALPAERGGSIPAAALTAYARSQDRTRVLLAGFDLHVAKPIDPGELLAVVQSLAAKRTTDAAQ